MRMTATILISIALLTGCADLKPTTKVDQPEVYIGHAPAYTNQDNILIPEKVVSLLLTNHFSVLNTNFLNAVETTKQIVGVAPVPIPYGEIATVLTTLIGGFFVGHARGSSKKKNDDERKRNQALADAEAKKQQG